jgi:hypothetical protein
MLHRFHDRFGTAGVVIGVIALIAALGGTALAAGGLSAKQKKEVKAIAKSFQGTGPQGPAGANGTNGSKGDTGANGKDGAPGEKGKDGTNGTPGTSVTNTPIAAGPSETKCNHLGGAEFKVGTGTGTFACNGAQGAAGGTLASGVTETGVWGVSASPDLPASDPNYPGFAIATISFPQPLPPGPETANTLTEFTIRYQTQPGFDTTCGTGAGGAGGSLAHPKAPPKTMCAWNAISPFSEELEGLQFKSTGAFPPILGFGTGHPSAYGAFLEFKIIEEPEAEKGTLGGTWAVTN